MRWTIPAFACAIILADATWGRAEQPFFMGLGDLPGGNFLSRSSDISADGSVVVGTSNSGGSANTGGGNAVYRWTRNTGMIDLGITDVGFPKVSADGSTVIIAPINAFTPSPAIRWTATGGPIHLPLGSSQAVSGDGSMVVGYKEQWTEVGGTQPLFRETSISERQAPRRQRIPMLQWKTL